jgi:ABC-2 type transport system permease protein
MQRNFVVCAGAYALILLGDATFYNVLGFDRAAAQTYFAYPVPFRAALHAKNVAALFFVLLEMTVLTGVCAAFRFIPDWASVAEGFAIVPVLACYFIAIGNLTSVRGPRPVDPTKSMRANSPGQVQLILILTLPLVASPLALAFLARWAFNSETAFFAVAAVSAIIGAAVYKVATDSAVATAGRDAESIVARLSQGSAPIG